MAQVEAKVSGATFGGLGAGVVLAILNGVQDDPNLLGNLPTFWQSIILLVIPTLVTFLAGYATPSNTSSVSSGTRRSAA